MLKGGMMIWGLCGDDHRVCVWRGREAGRSVHEYDDH